MREMDPLSIKHRGLAYHYNLYIYVYIYIYIYIYYIYRKEMTPLVNET